MSAVELKMKSFDSNDQNQNSSSIEEPNNEKSLFKNNQINPLITTLSSKDCKEKLDNCEKDEKKARIKEIIITILRFLLSTVLGFLFGWAMEKSKVHEPASIRQQMIFRKFIMIKMFLAALATSTLALVLIQLIFKKSYTKIFEGYRDSLKNKSFFSIILGASLIGIGMQVSGACPGMVLVQVGSGIQWSYLTLIGALLGALTHGLIDTYLMGKWKPDATTSKALFELIRLHPLITRIAFIVLLSAAVFLLEFFIPWTNEYKNPFADDGSQNILVFKAWPPFSCGIILGSLQFFSILLLSKSLGASSTYSTIAGIPFGTKLAKEKFGYLYKFRSGVANWIGVVYSVGAVLGGFASSYSSGVYGKSAGVHPYNALLGGFIMVFGSRIAGGCTSGHGISGSSHQFLGSLLAMATMFAAAIASGFYAYTNDFFLS